MTPAKRGDLIAVAETHVDYYIGSTTRESTEVWLAEAASVTREGIVKAFVDPFGGSIHKVTDRHKVYVVGGPERVNVSGVLIAQHHHCYPSHPNQPMPFDSLDEARDVVRAFLLPVTVAA